MTSYFSSGSEKVESCSFLCPFRMQLRAGCCHLLRCSPCVISLQYHLTPKHRRAPRVFIRKLVQAGRSSVRQFIHPKLKSNWSHGLDTADDTLVGTTGDARASSGRTTPLAGTFAQLTGLYPVLAGSGGLSVTLRISSTLIISSNFACLRFVICTA